MYKNWVIDVTTYYEDGFFCFVPVENLGGPSQVFVLGMNLLTSIDGFSQGKIVGFIHEGGQDAVDKWVKAHPEIAAQVGGKQ